MPIQYYKGKGVDGTFKQIGNMNLLEVEESRVLKQHRVGKFRAENLGEYHDRNPSKAIDTALGTQRVDEETRIGNVPQLTTWLDRYIDLLGLGYDIECISSNTII